MIKIMEGQSNYPFPHPQAKQQTAVEKTAESWLIFTWGTFLLLFLGSLLVAFGLPFGPIAFAVVAVASVIAYRYTYFSFYVAVILVMLLGLTVSIPVSEQEIVGRVFAGSIDLFLGEIVIMFVLCAWMVKVFVLWFRRHDVNWRPILPLWKSYATLIAAHIVSVFSSYGPDVTLVFKYVLRPVTFCYKPEIDSAGLPQFGLVAEEVDKIAPDLVARDDKNQIYTVRYEAVNAMMLNEFLKEHRKVAEQKTEIDALKQSVDELKQMVQSLAAKK